MSTTKKLQVLIQNLKRFFNVFSDRFFHTESKPIPYMMPRYEELYIRTLSLQISANYFQNRLSIQLILRKSHALNDFRMRCKEGVPDIIVMGNHNLRLNCLYQSGKHLMILFWTNMHNSDIVYAVTCHPVNLLLSSHPSPYHYPSSVTGGNPIVEHLKRTIKLYRFSFSIFRDAVTPIPVISSFGFRVPGCNSFDL